MPKSVADQELPMSVYRLDKTGRLTVVADDIKIPDGLAFSPDEKTLYIIDDVRPRSAPMTWSGTARGSPTAACSSAASERGVETACGSTWTVICGAGGPSMASMA